MPYGSINADLIVGTNGNRISPENTFGFRNRLINGGMVIDQRNAGASVTPTGASPYGLDRWSGILTQASKYSFQQNAGAVTPPTGYINYLGVTSLSAYSVLAGDTFALSQSIEGLNIADLAWGTANAKTVTLSFQVYSSLTGTFGGSLNNNGASRSYPFSYSVPTANTWTTVSVTIAGDTAGTWLTTNGIGIQVRLGLGSGSTFSGTAGAWTASNIVQPTGTVSVVGTNGATFYITGVQLEVGSNATSFDFRSFGTELALCKRYYQTFGANGAAATASQIHATITYPVEMRDTPSAYGVVSGGTCVQLNRSTVVITSLSGTFSSNRYGTGLFINSADTGMNITDVAWALSNSIFATAEL